MVVPMIFRSSTSFSHSLSVRISTCSWPRLPFFRQKVAPQEQRLALHLQHA